MARSIALGILHGSDENLTHPQYFMLKKLMTGSVTVSGMADYMGVSLSAVTSMADRMVKTKYIARKRTEDDRRLVWLEITDSGREVLEGVLSKRKETITGFLSRLSEEELEALYSIYTKILGFVSEKSEK
ncbi:MAG: MarR family transcriptional regulator [Desulfocucumaceae bacterium]